MKNLLFSLICSFLTISLGSCQNKQKNDRVSQSVEQKETVKDLKKVSASIILDTPFDFATISETNQDIGVFPFVSDLPEFAEDVSISNKTSIKDFDRVLVYAKDKFLTFEGKVHHRRRIINDEYKGTFSAHKVRKSYEDMFLKMGATKVFSVNTNDQFNGIFNKIPEDELPYITKVGTHGASLYALKKENAKILFYLSIDANSGGYYDLYVMQDGELTQTLALITADEMKKELDNKGFVALYVNFDTDKSVIKPESKPIISEINNLLKAYSDLKISIEGHTDNTGSSVHNKKLSEDRAASVMKALVDLKINADRLKFIGYGAEKPLVANDSEENKAKNRRVEIVRIK